MVRAGNTFDLTLTRQKFMPAVLADVVVCAKFAISIPQRDDGLALNIHRDKTARLAKFLFVAQELPAAMKNLLPFDLEKPRIGITASINRMGTDRYWVVFPENFVKFIAS